MLYIILCSLAILNALSRKTLPEAVLLGKYLKSPYATSCLKQVLFSYFWYIYLELSVSLYFCSLSLFLVNCTQALYVNLNCYKCISDNICTYICYNKISPNTGTLSKGVLIYKLFNKHFVSWFLINIDFLLSHNAHFDKSIILPFFVSVTLGFLLFVFLLHFKQSNNIGFYIV